MLTPGWSGTERVTRTSRTIRLLLRPERRRHAL